MNQKSTRGVQQEEVFAQPMCYYAERLRPTIERARKIGRGSPHTVGADAGSVVCDLGASPGRRTGNGGEMRRRRPCGMSSRRSGLQHYRPPKVRRMPPLPASTKVSLQNAQVLDAARQDLARHEAALAERSVALEQALELAKSQLREQNRTPRRPETELFAGWPGAGASPCVVCLVRCMDPTPFASFLW